MTSTIKTALTTNRVEVITIARLDAPKKQEHAVTLDGAIVHREGGTSQVDFCHASGVAEGIRIALSLASA